MVNSYLVFLPNEAFENRQAKLPSAQAVGSFHFQVLTNVFGKDHLRFELQTLPHGGCISISKNENGFSGLSIFTSNHQTLLIDTNSLNQKNHAEEAANLLEKDQRWTTYSHYCQLCFKENGKVNIQQDITGLKAPFAINTAAGWWLSNYVLLLRPLADKPSAVRYEALASQVFLGWASGNSLLFTGIDRLDANHPGLERESPFIIETASNRKITDETSLADITALMENLANELGSFGQLNTELTAGGDTRALLGLLLHCGLHPEVNSAGQPDTLDVKTAAIIAKRYNLKQNVYSPQKNLGAEQFWKLLYKWAFVSHGKGNALAIAQAQGILQFTNQAFKPAVGGEFGGIFKGYFYPGTESNNWQGWDAAMLAKYLLQTHLHKRKAFWDAAALATVDMMEEQLAKRLDHWINRYQSAPNALDALFSIDMFASSYFTGNMNWIPKLPFFVLPAMVEKAMCMPWHDRNKYLPHKHYIGKLSRIRSLPINAQYFNNSLRMRETTRMAKLAARWFKLHPRNDQHAHRQEALHKLAQDLSLGVTANQYMQHLFPGMERKQLPAQLLAQGLTLAAADNLNQAFQNMIKWK